MDYAAIARGLSISLLLAAIAGAAALVAGIFLAKTGVSVILGFISSGDEEGRYLDSGVDPRENWNMRRVEDFEGAGEYQEMGNNSAIDFNSDEFREMVRRNNEKFGDLPPF